MKSKITFLTIGLFLVAQIGVAQFNRDDIQFWVGEGDSESYLAVDFRDGTTDPSFAWGYRFNAADEPTFADIIIAVSAVEPKFSYDFTGGFLNDIIYNDHSGYAGDPDYWSTWSGDESNNMLMNSGISEDAEDGRWYGISYGFSPAQMPTITYPAYSSLWFSDDELEYPIGEGSDYAVIVVDFVEEVNGESASFAWKVAFDGSITSQEALQLIGDNDSEFEIVFTGDEISGINYFSFEGEEWLSYNGTDMSNWKLDETNTVLENADWFGIAKGTTYTRRPFIPVPAEENPVLGIDDFAQSSIVIYPNPASELIYIKSTQPVQAIIFDLHGRIVSTVENATNNAIDVSSLQKGVYIISITVDSKTTQHKFVKK